MSISGQDVRPLAASSLSTYRFWHTVSMVVVAGLLALVAATCLVAYLPAGQGLKDTVDNVTTTSSVIIATILCFCASQVVRHARERIAWLILALSFLCNVIAESLWTYYELGAGISLPIGSLADVFYLAFYPLALVGILLLVQPRDTRVARTLTVLDSLLFTLGISGVLWQLIIVPSISGEMDPTALFTTLAYPVGDFLLIFALCSLFLTAELSRVRTAATLLLASFVATVVADLGFAYLALNEEYASGSPIDPLWTVGYALAALAALRRLQETRQSEMAPSLHTALGATRRIMPHVQGLLRLLVPYVAAPAAVGMIALALAEADAPIGTTQWLVIGFALALLGIVMVRQFLTVLDNARLSRSMEALSRDLETRVEERTSELTTLNHAATVLSRCLRTGDVLEAGLTLAASALRADGGAIWLRRREELERASLRLEPSTVKALEPYVDGRLAADGASDQRQIEWLDAATVSDPAADDGPPPCWLMAVPLLSRGSAVGMLTMLLRTGPDQPSHAQLAESLGAQIGIAVENAMHYEETRRLAERDSVTGILNHRVLQLSLEQECRRAARSAQPFSIVMMDLDGFKLFNDTYGHPGGDAALRHVAALITGTVRATDIVGRYGGDEFMALLPDTTASDAIGLSERLRESLASSPFTTPNGEHIPLLLSIGVASYPGDGVTANELIARADANLYHSKHHGGDQITAVTEGDEVEYGAAGMFGVLDSLITAVDAKDRYTRQHSDDVTVHALMLARQLSMSYESQDALRVAGLLHDVGKIGVPDRILRKPGRLTEGEMEVVRHHVLLSEMIINEIPNLHDVVTAAGSHHERWDGGGYPRGLAGEQIPLLGRILSVADAWSAMTTDRPYRKALSDDDARAELRRMKGSQFDPALVDAFLLALDEDSPDPAVPELEAASAGCTGGWADATAESVRT